jgi:hypothetical protein
LAKQIDDGATHSTNASCGTGYDDGAVKRHASASDIRGRQPINCAFARYLISSFPRKRETDAGRQAAAQTTGVSRRIDWAVRMISNKCGLPGQANKIPGVSHCRWHLSLRQRALGNLTQVPGVGLLLHVN